MKVLLLYPRFPETFWGFQNALKFVRRKAALPPLGLQTVAAMLPQSWSKRLVDENVRGLTTADLAWPAQVVRGRWDSGEVAIPLGRDAKAPGKASGSALAR